MSNFKFKYEENLRAAQLLVQKEYFSASVHCYYYACVQLMLHILRFDVGISEEDIDVQQREASKSINGGFHSWIINKMFELLMVKNFIAASEFNDWIGELKSMRVRADYKEEILTKNKTKAIGEKVSFVIETLKNNFKI